MVPPLRVPGKPLKESQEHSLVDLIGEDIPQQLKNLAETLVQLLPRARTPLTVVQIPEAFDQLTQAVAPARAHGPASEQLYLVRGEQSVMLRLDDFTRGEIAGPGATLDTLGVPEDIGRLVPSGTIPISRFSATIWQIQGEADLEDIASVFFVGIYSSHWHQSLKGRLKQKTLDANMKCSV